ncbi:MAG: extracellular solute-binding protein [Bacteriovoracaceae bacterium]|nr:extracellular solute-binding protein [Bacteriovoracaceae bacterium]
MKEEVKPEKKKIWIYSSLWKGTIENINEQLSKKFPDIEFHWFREGSEEIASKAEGQILTDGEINADIIIATSRLWLEEMANKGYLTKLNTPLISKIPNDLKHPENLFSTFSIPVMIPVYNSQKISKKDAPTNFKDFSNKKWKGKIAIGNPLSSGTNFTTMAMLQHHYGWEFIKSLRTNETLAQGGNDSVYKSLKSGRRDIGWLTMDIMLRYMKEEKVLKHFYPKDGVIIQHNVLALPKRKEKKDYRQEVAEWFFGKEAQSIMTDAYSYSPFPGIEPPEGGKPLSELRKSSFKWSQDVIKSILKSRKDLKDGFMDILYKVN